MQLKTHMAPLNEAKQLVVEIHADDMTIRTRRGEVLYVECPVLAVQPHGADRVAVRVARPNAAGSGLTIYAVRVEVISP